MKVGDMVTGSWGKAGVVGVFPNTGGRVVQLSYPFPGGWSTTELAISETETVYRFEWPENSYSMIRCS